MSAACRFGVVGTGRMAATIMACLALEPRAGVVAVAGSDAARAQDFARRHGIPVACASLADLLARADVDAVYVANATRDHARTAIAALEAGKAVLCEKPFAIDVAEAAEVAAVAARTGKLFVEAQWTVHLPAFLALQKAIADGALGTVTHASSSFGRSLDPATHRRLFEGAGAGVLLDFGVYPITFARMLLGPVTSVRAALRRTAAGVDVQASLQLTHAGGAQSQLAASLVADLPNTSSVGGSHGLATLVAPVMGAEAIELRRGAPYVAGDDAAAPAGAKQALVAALKRQRWLRKLKATLGGPRADVHPFGADRYAPQLSHFLTVFASGARESDRMPIAASLDVLRVIEQARLDATTPP